MRRYSSMRSYSFSAENMDVLRVSAIDDTGIVNRRLDLYVRTGVDLNRQDPQNGQTALHINILINKGRHYIVDHLLRSGADANLQDMMGATPMHSACKIGDSKSVETLTIHNGHMDAYDKLGMAPMHVAMENNQFETVRFMMEVLAGDVNLRTGTKLGESALHLAVKEGSIEKCKFLLDLGADVNIPTKAIHGTGMGMETPLHFAVRYRKVAVLKLLLERGADPNLGDVINMSPIERNLIADKFDGSTVPMLETLLDAGSCLDAIVQDAYVFEKISQLERQHKLYPRVTHAIYRAGCGGVRQLKQRFVKVHDVDTLKLLLMCGYDVANKILLPCCNKHYVDVHKLYWGSVSLKQLCRNTVREQLAYAYSTSVPPKQDFGALVSSTEGRRLSQSQCYRQFFNSWSRDKLEGPFYYSVPYRMINGLGLGSELEDYVAFRDLPPDDDDDVEKKEKVEEDEDVGSDSEGSEKSVIGEGTLGLHYRIPKGRHD